MPEKKKTTKRRSTGTTTGKRVTAAQKRAQEQKKNELKIEVLWILYLGIMILFMMINCNVIKTDFCVHLRAISFGIFGVLSYVLPILIFLLSGFIYINKGVRLMGVKVTSIIALIVSAGIIAELLSGIIPDYSDEFPVLKDAIPLIYKTGSEQFKGGGVIFGMLSLMICNLIGKVGTWLILVVVIIVSTIFLTEKSLMRALHNGGKSLREGSEHEREIIAESLQNSREARAEREERRRLAREEHEEKRRLEQEDRERKRLEKEEAERIAEEQKETSKILRRDNMVRGVMLDPRVSDTSDTLLQEGSIAEPVPTTGVHDDMHEIQVINTEAFEPVTVTPSAEAPVPKKDEYSYEFDDIPVPITERNNKDYITDSQEYKEPVIPEVVPKASEVKQPEVKPESERKAPGRPVSKYKLPPVNLLNKNEMNRAKESDAEIQSTAKNLREALKNFGINVEVKGISQGPSITRFEIQPELGVPVSRIVKLSDDIQMSLAATSIRIEAPIPGKSAVGIEIPNKVKTMVLLRDLIETEEFKSNKSKISFTVGKDLAGKNIIDDIHNMPHLLIAGTTGSGKSVCINAIVMSILYHASPDEVKMILVDPKQVELSIYNGLPHLCLPVVNSAKMTVTALKWAVAEMQRRYRIFVETDTKELRSYNAKIGDGTFQFEGETVGKLPEIVFIIDELADIMAEAAKEVEESISRLAALARAAGIHLILATQRPSVDVITGTIKANMPSRIAFMVKSGVDSRTILDSIGAEKLLGKGDMLYYPSGYSKPIRVQGIFVSEEEIGKVVSFIKAQNIETDTNLEAKIKAGSNSGDESGGSLSVSGGNELDELFEEAGRFLISRGKASIGNLQRNFKIGFNRAARIVDQLAEAGVLGPEEGTKPREIRMTIDQFEEYLNK